MNDKVLQAAGMQWLKPPQLAANFHPTYSASFIIHTAPISDTFTLT
jgi:hypothetical protein